MKILLFLLFFLLFLSFLPLIQAEDDRTLSSYFFAKGKTDTDPIKIYFSNCKYCWCNCGCQNHSSYRNKGKTTIEAIYIFPCSTKATDYGMKMTIGNRLIEAKIEEKEKAKQQYSEAIQQGKSASFT